MSTSWDDQRIFLAVLEEGSLSGASRRLGLSHATVRTRLEALEASLGVVLFTRSVNGLTPTESAEALRQSARAMAMASEQFVRQASSAPGEASGVVRISVPEFMGIEVLPPMIASLRAVHPAIRIELSLSDLHADLLAQEVDIAVRAVRPTQDGLLARKVATIPLAFFASRAYVERRGLPMTPDDLIDHDVIGPDRNRRDLEFAERVGPAFNRNRLALRTDSHPAHLAAVRAGVGIGVAQVPVGRRDPALVHVLPELVIAELETWLVTHENLGRVPKVRAVLDHLAVAFADYVRMP